MSNLKSTNSGRCGLFKQFQGHLIIDQLTLWLQNLNNTLITFGKDYHLKHILPTCLKNRGTPVNLLNCDKTYLIDEKVFQNFDFDLVSYTEYTKTF